MRMTFALVLALLPGMAAAAGSPVFAPPAQGYWLRPGAAGSKNLYGALDNRANWAVGQWNSPQDLPPFAPRGGGEATANAAAAITVGADGSLTLEQDGGPLTCEKDFPKGSFAHEFDLTAQPLSRTNAPGFPVATLGRPIDFGSIAHLYHTITLQVLSVAPVAGDPCRVTQAVFMSAVTLSNPSQHQVLFYQLRLAHMRDNGGGPAWQMPRPGWFYRGANAQSGARGHFGFDDSLASFGAAAAQPGGAPVAISVDLYPRLVSVIQDGAALGMDQTLGDWRVTGTYHGSAIWGHVRVVSRWSGFSLAAGP